MSTVTVFDDGPVTRMSRPVILNLESGHSLLLCDSRTPKKQSSYFPPFHWTNLLSSYSPYFKPLFLAMKSYRSMSFSKARRLLSSLCHQSGGIQDKNVNQNDMRSTQVSCPYLKIFSTALTRVLTCFHVCSDQFTWH